MPGGGKDLSGAEHSDGNEQDLVAALRKGGAHIPKLSLVARMDRKLGQRDLMWSKGADPMRCRLKRLKTPGRQRV